jgi:hypothetical protein
VKGISPCLVLVLKWSCIINSTWRPLTYL